MPIATVRHANMCATCCHRTSLYSKKLEKSKRSKHKLIHVFASKVYHTHFIYCYTNTHDHYTCTYCYLTTYIHKYAYMKRLVTE